jgi:hypothetical protein
LSQRQEAILLSLKKLDFLNREQLQRLHRLGKTRNTNRILSDLSPWLSSFREGYSSIYYLSALGRDAVGAKKPRRKNQFVNHVIMRNEFYLFAKCPTDWKNELKVKDGHDSIIPDSWFKTNGMYHFLEVDSTQKMSVNRQKVEKYKGFFQRKHLERHFGYVPPLLWLTSSKTRKKQLEELCESLPSSMVYTIDEIK